MNKVLVEIEAIVRNESSKSNTEIVFMVTQYLRRHVSVFVYDQVIPINESDEIFQHIDRLVVVNNENDDSSLPYSLTNKKPHKISYWQADVQIIPIRLIDELPEKDYIGDSEDTTSAFELWQLPNKHLYGLWDSIIVDANVKQNLIGYFDTSIR